MPMSPRLLRPRASGTAFHAEAIDWASRVTANGGTVTTNTLAAVSTFCSSIQAAGIRDRFYRLNLFAGEVLLSALVPLYRNTSLSGSVLGNATDTNVNFTSSDYANTGTAGGLTGASNKVLQTGVTGSLLPQLQTAHIMVSVSSGLSVTGDTTVLGHSSSGNHRNDIYGGRTASNAGHVFMTSTLTNGSAGVINANNSSFARRWIGSCTGNSSRVVYRDGVSFATSSGTESARTGNVNQFSVFAANSATSGCFPGRIHCYSFGDGMDATQVAAFDAAIAAFLTTMGRT